ncbi:MAG: hypothetical protein ACR2QA_00745 [Solirubrobacteraceae bacterium]
MSAVAVADASPAPAVTGRWARGATRLLIVACLTVVAAVLRFSRIGHQGFWYDESFTVLLVHPTPSEMLGLLPRTELTPPFPFGMAMDADFRLRRGRTALSVRTGWRGYGAGHLRRGSEADLSTRRADCCRDRLL